MKAQQYAEALYLATDGKPDDVVDAVLTRMRALLEERGHGRLLPAIVREYEKVVRTRQATVETTVRVARASDVAAFRTRIAQDVEDLGAADLPEHTVVDEQVVGGYEVRAHGKRIDRTYRRMLVTLYSNLVSQS